MEMGDGTLHYNYNVKKFKSLNTVQLSPDGIKRPSGTARASAFMQTQRRHGGGKRGGEEGGIGRCVTKIRRSTLFRGVITSVARIDENTLRPLRDGPSHARIILGIIQASCWKSCARERRDFSRCRIINFG